MQEHFEVESKFSLKKSESGGQVEKRLRALGFAFCGERQQYDYFIPGTRKGELLRVRVEGTQYFLTFKERVRIEGKKTRRESEPNIHPLAGHLIIEAARNELRSDLPVMYKLRRDFKRAWSGFEVNVVIDYVPELDPPFSSHFMEIEVIVEDPHDVARAKKVIKEIALRIFGEKRKRIKLSYRKMLFKTLKARGAFPKRWNRLTGSKKGKLDPRDNDGHGINPSATVRKQNKVKKKSAKRGS